MNLEKVCRMCSSEKTRVKSIFKNYKREKLLSIITDVVQLDVCEGDGFPPNICKPCASTLIRIQDNLEEFRENERELRMKILNLRGPPNEVTEEDKEDTKFEMECELGKEEDAAEENSGVRTEPKLKSHPSSMNKVEEPNEQDHARRDEFSTEAFVPEIVLIKEELSPEDDSNIHDFDIDEQTVSSNDSESTTMEETNQKRKLAGTQLTEKQRAKLLSEIPAQKSTRRGRRNLEEDEHLPRVNDHKCYICRSESMGSAKALLEHLITHRQQVPHTCTECKMETVVLKTLRSLNYHMKMHAQPIKCEYCDRRYCDDRARLYHVKAFHLGESAPCSSVCEQCGKVCSSLSALKTHMRDHQHNFRCEYCDKIFHRRNKLKDHVTRVHEKAEKYECNICHRVVHSLGSYNTHLKMHTVGKAHECDLCPMKFYTAGNLRLHKKVHRENANYKPHKDWSGHYTVQQDPGMGKIFTCKLCGKTYDNIMKINNHLKYHFKEIKCDQCDRMFVNESQLRVHYVVHTGVKQHKCEFCGKDFLHRTNYTQHLKLHRNEQNFACEFCGKLFTYKEGMKAHIRNHHLLESPHECLLCQRKFVDNASLERHNAAEHEPLSVPIDLGPPPLVGAVPKFELLGTDQVEK